MLDRSIVMNPNPKFNIAEDYISDRNFSYLSRDMSSSNIHVADLDQS